MLLSVRCRVVCLARLGCVVGLVSDALCVALWTFAEGLVLSAGERVELSFWELLRMRLGVEVGGELGVALCVWGDGGEVVNLELFVCMNVCRHMCMCHCFPFAFIPINGHTLLHNPSPHPIRVSIPSDPFGLRRTPSNAVFAPPNKPVIKRP